MLGPSRLDAKLLPALGWAMTPGSLSICLLMASCQLCPSMALIFIKRSTLGRLPLSRPSRRWSRCWGSGSWEICIFDPVLRHRGPMDKRRLSQSGELSSGLVKNRLRSDVGIVLRDMSRDRPPESRVSSPHRGVRSGTWLDFALLRCADWRRKNRPTNNPRKQKGRRVARIGSNKGRRCLRPGSLSAPSRAWSSLPRLLLLHIDIAFPWTVAQNHSALSIPLDQGQDGVRSASMGSKTAFR